MDQPSLSAPEGFHRGCTAASTANVIAPCTHWLIGTTPPPQFCSTPPKNDDSPPPLLKNTHPRPVPVPFCWEITAMLVPWGEGIFRKNSTLQSVADGLNRNGVLLRSLYVAALSHALGALLPVRRDDR